MYVQMAKNARLDNGKHKIAVCYAAQIFHWAVVLAPKAGLHCSGGLGLTCRFVRLATYTTGTEGLAHQRTTGSDWKFWEIVSVTIISKLLVAPQPCNLASSMVSLRLPLKGYFVVLFINACLLS